MIAMYPPGLFWLLDSILQDRCDLVRRVVEFATGSTFGMTDDEIEAVWDAREAAGDLNDYLDKAKEVFAEQREADRERIQAVAAQARGGAAS